VSRGVRQRRIGANSNDWAGPLWPQLLISQQQESRSCRSGKTAAASSHWLALAEA
jgi:hypothetical protein